MGYYMEIFEARVLGENFNPSKIMIITSHMQKIIQIDPCLLKLSRKQDTILKISDFSTKNMELFEARVLGGNLTFWLKNHQF
jgi:hypothetical protein